MDDGFDFGRRIFTGLRWWRGGFAAVGGELKITLVEEGGVVRFGAIFLFHKLFFFKKYCFAIA